MGLSNDAARFRFALRMGGAAASLLILLYCLGWFFEWPLVSFGIYPRRLSALPMVFIAPLVHGSGLHLLSNTPSVLVLVTMLFYAYPRAAPRCLGVLYVGSGLAVWVFAREAYHVGASGVATGLVVLLFTMGVLRWDPRAMAFAMIVFFLYGGVIWGVLPTDPAVSFESHLSGAVLGFGLALVARNLDPAPPRKRYAWEDQDEGDEEGDEEGDDEGDDETWSASMPDDDPQDDDRRQR